MTQFDQRYQQVETQYNAEHITIQQQPLSLTEKQRKQNRTRMLDRVQTIWINGVLEHALHGAAQLALGLREQHSAVVNPWQLVLQEFDQSGPLLPADARIEQVYDRANGEVLILGEPGAGKTMLLLELVRDLLERARRDETHPIPVVFNLSSWATSRQPLSDWLVSELTTKYQVPRRLAASWIETDQVLPLLDGLDEVAASHRAACVEAINTYRRAHGLLPTVVCCRQTDYEMLPKSVHLQLHTAVMVQPLTPQQIETYLANGGEQLGTLRQTLHEDADLQTLARTPLMLNVLTVAYQGTPHKEIAVTGSLETKQEQIFATYVQRMLARRRISTHFTPAQTIHWLSWLARQMRQHNQTVFYIEQLQFNWLSGNRMLLVYDWLGVRLPGMLIGALVGLAVSMFLVFNSLSIAAAGILLGGFLGELWSGGRAAQRFVASEEKARSALWQRILQWLGIGALIGLLVALAFGLDLSVNLPASLFQVPFRLLVGLSFGVSFGLSFGLWNILLQILLEKSDMTENSLQASHRPPGTMWQRLVRFIRSPGVGNGLLTGLLFALVAGLVFTLVFGLVFALANGSVTGLVLGLLVGLVLGLGLGLVFGLGLGLSSGLLSVLLMGKGATVQPVDQLVWSWGRKLFSKRHIRPTVVFGLIFGLITGLVAGLVAGLITGLVDGLVNGLILGLGYWLLLGFLQGVSSATIEDRRRVLPNQGIRRSAFNSLALGLVSAMIVGLVNLLSIGLAPRLSTGLGAGLGAGLVTGLGAELLAGLLAGLSAGLVAGLLNGGLACLRHYVLRFLLWRARSMPWNYVRFLDDAAACILLRKVGGGYIFLHRLLLDYFAEQESAPVLDEPTERRQSSTSAPVSPSNVPSEPTVPLSPPAALSEAPRLLPCGHELRTPNARFCSVCGTPVPS